MLPFINDILRYDSLSIVGLEKNTGKTECLKYACQELNNGTILPTRGFTTPVTVAPIQVSTTQEKTDKPLFIKMISGFGGSNAALLFAKNDTAILRNFMTEK